jgi:hypothetical protein
VIFIPALALWLGKMLSGKFILNRVMAGTGSAYFYRKGRKTGRRRYIVTAVGIYVLSWALLLVSFGYIVTLLVRWLEGARFW